MRFHALTLALFFVLASALAVAFTGSVTGGTIVAQVQECLSNESIAGARVQITNPPTVYAGYRDGVFTDDRGEVWLTNLQPVRHGIFVSRSGYGNVSTNATPAAGRAIGLYVCLRALNTTAGASNASNATPTPSPSPECLAPGQKASACIVGQPPLYCNAFQELVQNCAACGCPVSRPVCQADGTCGYYAALNASNATNASSESNALFPPAFAPTPAPTPIVSPLPTPDVVEGTLEFPAANVEIILDASESMGGLVDGRVKMDVAKEFAAQLLARIRPDADAKVGLRAYGSEYGTQEPRSLSCSDSRLLAPVAALNKPLLTAQVQALQPKGLTPIQHALQQAAADLAQRDGTKLVILVSDGVESCGGHYCYSAELTRNKINVYAIGFDVDQQGRDNLGCIARATGGTYVDARNADELLEAINFILVSEYVPPSASASREPTGPTPQPEKQEASPFTGLVTFAGDNALALALLALLILAGLGAAYYFSTHQDEFAA